MTRRGVTVYRETTILTMVDDVTREKDSSDQCDCEAGRKIYNMTAVKNDKCDQCDYRADSSDQ